jgi:type II secretory pathway component PulJ
MGSQVIIDIIGSFIIFGWLLLMSLRMNVGNSENMQTYRGELLVQQNLVEVTKLLEYDFRKIGFCLEPNMLPDPTKSILVADSNRIKFLTDVDLTGSGPDGTLDSIYYYLGPTSEIPETSNPRDRLLYRVVNNQTPNGSNLGVTYFNLKYFDALGNVIALPITGVDLQRIQTIQISITVENVVAAELVETAPLNQQYASAFWQQMRLSSRNYRNR